jgi:hypothetical protein
MELSNEKILRPKSHSSLGLDVRGSFEEFETALLFSSGTRLRGGSEETLTAAFTEP